MVFFISRDYTHHPFVWSPWSACLWNWLILMTFSRRSKQLPDRPFYNFGNSESDARRSLTTRNLLILQLKNVKEPVGCGCCCCCCCKFDCSLSQALTLRRPAERRSTGIQPASFYHLWNACRSDRSTHILGQLLRRSCREKERERKPNPITVRALITKKGKERFQVPFFLSSPESHSKQQMQILSETLLVKYVNMRQGASIEKVLEKPENV